MPFPNEVKHVSVGLVLGPLQEVKQQVHISPAVFSPAKIGITKANQPRVIVRHIKPFLIHVYPLFALSNDTQYNHILTLR